MSDEPTERDVENLAPALWQWGGTLAARAVLTSDWYADRIAEARREGAAEADAILDEYLRLGPVDVLRAALRGDA